MIIESRQIPNHFEQYFEKEIESIKKSMITNPFATLLYYQKENKIKGYLLYSKIYERIEVEDIKVADNFQNQHIASNLLEKLITIAKENHIVNITLEVRKNNEVAIHLYKKFGFQIEAIRKNYYGKQDGLLMMRSFKKWKKI